MTALSNNIEKEPDSNSYVIATWLFLRALGGIYVIAFLSLLVQVKGLYGENGILPAARYLEILSHHGLNNFFATPTVFWLNCSDFALQLVCWLGILSGACITFGFITAPSAFFCWLLYLSLITIGQDFLTFQWDILLLEAGFLTIFLAPWRGCEQHWRPILQKLWHKNVQIPGYISGDYNPPIPMIWLLRWLLFRLMFQSGLCKLASGDPTWANLTALNYHYWTQPLPTPLAWYVAKLPEYFQRLSVAMVFFIELIVPFFIFTPRKLRLCAAFAIIFLQTFIALTGNYAFFNLLTVALCLSLVDDHVLENTFKKLLPKTLLTKLTYTAASGNIAESKDLSADVTEQGTALFRWDPNVRRYGQRIAAWLVAIFIGLLSFLNFGSQYLGSPILFSLLQPVERFFFLSNYGLFAVMTTERLEIVMQGSNDGISWQSYEFKYKPGNLAGAPCIVAPHQPRLDWQMWFASLSTYRDNLWFLNFAFRLLQGSPDVIALLKYNPFSEKPPHFIRAELYRYRFTDFQEKAKTGHWWQREYAGLYLPPISFSEKNTK